jgi:adenosylhomocysteine nucleosidase
LSCANNAGHNADMPLAIMGAMPEETDALLPHLMGRRHVARAGRAFVHGELWGTPVIVVFSRWGKVAAASTATELIVAHDADRILFLGIAGALDPRLAPGDIVVARELYHHDLDASPFFAPTAVPLLGVRGLPTDEGLSAALLAASAGFLAHGLAAAAEPRLVERFGLASRRAVRADIASGDQVIFSAAAKVAVRRRVPSAACVEMEGAAVAQVCFEHAVPFACARTISDAADESGAADVAPFFAGLAGAYTIGIIRRFLMDVL